MSRDLGHERTWNDDMWHAQPVGQTRGIPLEIVSNVASRNGVLESLARSDNVIGIRHLHTIEFVRVPKATGASWRQIGDSLGQRPGRVRTVRRARVVRTVSGSTSVDRVRRTTDHHNESPPSQVMWRTISLRSSDT